MFPTFSGNARSKRQVDLSGRRGPARPHAGSANAAIVHAQQERLVREYERRRPPAAERIQRIWRGHAGRRKTRLQWRQQWDQVEGWESDHCTSSPYQEGAEMWLQLRRLAQFATVDDVLRIQHFALRSSAMLTESKGSYAVFHLAQIIVQILGSPVVSASLSSDLVAFLALLARISPDFLLHYATQYYRSLAKIRDLCPNQFPSAVRALLRPHSILPYRAILSELLTQCLDLPDGLDIVVLTEQLEWLVTGSNLTQKTPMECLWLLGHYIEVWDQNIDSSHITIVGGLLPRVAGLVQSITMLPPYIQRHLRRLLSPESLHNLVSQRLDDAALQAGYILMLLAHFPTQNDEIHLSLFRHTTSTPVTKYFFHAAKTTVVWRQISQHPDAVAGLLRTAGSEWEVILLFFELYSFVLRFMDDEEFRTGSEEPVMTSSWTRASALPIGDIRSLVSFLKNLAFALYYHAVEISRHHPDSIESSSQKLISGMTVDRIKGLATGLLRMIYEREYVYIGDGILVMTFMIYCPKSNRNVHVEMSFVLNIDGTFLSKQLSAI